MWVTSLGTLPHRVLAMPKPRNMYLAMFVDYNGVTPGSSGGRWSLALSTSYKEVALFKQQHNGISIRQKTGIGTNNVGKCT